MDSDNTDNNTTARIKPDMSGRGKEFLDMIQMLQHKEVTEGYLGINRCFRFSAAFSYPVIFRLQSTGTWTQITAMGFDVTQHDKTKQLVEEKFIVPKVCRKITRDSIVYYFADVIEHDSCFALYLHEKPSVYRKILFHGLIDDQELVFDEHLVMAVMEILDNRKSTSARDHQ